MASRLQRRRRWPLLWQLALMALAARAGLARGAAQVAALGGEIVSFSVESLPSSDVKLLLTQAGAPQLQVAPAGGGNSSGGARAAARGANASSITGHVVPYDYNSQQQLGGDEDDGEGVAVAYSKLPLERGGLKLQRWVLCSWSVGNISAADVLHSTSLRSLASLQYVPRLLSVFTTLAPEQVLAAASANVTLAYHFQGLQHSGAAAPGAAAAAAPSSSVAGWTAGQVDAVRDVSSDMAGGFNERYIKVTDSKPPAAGKGDAIHHRKHAPPPSGARGGKDPGGRGGLGAPVPPEVLAEMAAAAAAAAAPAPAAEPAPAPAADGGRRRRRARRLLATAAPTMPAPAPDVWVIYTRLAPENATALLSELLASCGVSNASAHGTRLMAPGTNLTREPCGEAMLKALRRAGMGMHEASYSQSLLTQPTVSLSIRLAIGITEAQAAAGLDAELARFLAQPSTIGAVANVYTPDAVVRWLHHPEVWRPQPYQAPKSLSPGAAVGVAVGGAAFICSVVGLVAWLVFRHRRRHQASSSSGHDAGDTVSDRASRPRRRRQGKRRYLLPEAPRPDSVVTPGTTGSPGAGSSAAAEAAAAAANGDSDDLNAPDQIRPALKALGDSVTSAVRFEQDDEDEVGSPAAGAASPSATSAAAPAAAQDAGVSSSGRAVLAARAELLAEQQHQQQQPAAASSAGSGAAAGAAAAGLPAASTAEGAADTALVSNRGGWVPGAPAAAGAEPTGLQLPALAAAAAEASTAAAVALSSAATPHSKRSPFAVAYDFSASGLHDASASGSVAGSAVPASCCDSGGPVASSMGSSWAGATDSSGLAGCGSATVLVSDGDAAGRQLTVVQGAAGSGAAAGAAARARAGSALQSGGSSGPPTGSSAASTAPLLRRHQRH